MNTALFVFLACVALFIFVQRQRRHYLELVSRRKAYFDRCLSLFDQYSLSQDGIDYPRLVGRIDGHEIQVAPVIDTLSVRKLPSLWLLVTMAHPLPVKAVFDMLIRPLGTEGFTNYHLLPTTIPTPAGWPNAAVIRTNDPSGLPPLELLDLSVARLESKRLKELLISPNGVRIVVQAAEGLRDHYLAYRDAIFKTSELEESRLREIVEVLFQIKSILEHSKGALET